MEGSESSSNSSSFVSPPDDNVTHRRDAAQQLSTPAKRNRTQLSCIHCRHSKLKCDRQEPCSQCSKRGRAAQCVFPAVKTVRKPAVSMRKRLEHLESLVKNVMPDQGREQAKPVSRGSSIAAAMQGKDNSQFTRDSIHTEQVPGTLSQNVQSEVAGIENGLPDSSGSVVRGTTETAYVGATHWAAILNNIEEVKSYFSTEEVHDDTPDEMMRLDSSLLFSFQTLTKEDIIAALPNRQVVDRLMSAHFNSDSPSLHLLHRPTFKKEYGRFWANPSGTPLTWIAMLYAIMSLATFASYRTGVEMPDQRGSHMEIIQMYRGCCSQSLVLSDYNKPGFYTIETLLFYGEGGLIMNNIAQVSGYTLAGVVVRLALRMGLHRDPSKVGGKLSAFQAEFRRRIWHQIVQIDQLVSFHIGLPAMATAIESDTELPGNFRDEDFDSDTVKLPPPRPDTEFTPMSYTIAKSRLCKAFGMVAAQANKLSLPPYEEVMKIDTLLNDAYAKVPSLLRLTPLELAITDSAAIIMKRFSLALMYYRSRCVLHRQYLLKAKDSALFAYSKHAGLDASMKLLHIQISAHRAIQPDGHLSKSVWFMSSLVVHDFLLAATIVYLNLIQVIETTRKPLDDEQMSMLQAIEKSHAIWSQTKDDIEAAKKASDILELMLAKIKLAINRNNSVDGNNCLPPADKPMPNGDAWMADLSLNDSTSTDHSNHYPISTDWGRTNGISSQILDPTIFDAQCNSSLPLTTDLFQDILDMNFDWDLFDSHMRPPVPMVDQSWPDVLLEENGIDNNDLYYNL